MEKGFSLCFWGESVWEMESRCLMLAFAGHAKGYGEER